MRIQILRMYANIKLFLKRRPVLIVLEILVVFLLTILVDRLLGIYFEKSFYFKAYLPGMIQIHETAEYQFKATISSQGLRNEEVGNKQKGTLRIMALGDSFTWGWGVEAEKSWPKVLQKMLIDSGKNVEIINAGVAGGDLWWEIETCNDYVSQFKPDLILLGFYSTDDIFQNLDEYVKNKNFIESQKFWYQVVYSLWPNFIKLKGDRYVYPPPKLNSNHEHYVKDSWKKIADDNTRDGKEDKVLANVSEKIRNDFKNGDINPLLVLLAQINPTFFTFILNRDDLSIALNGTDALLSKLKQCTKNIPTVIVFVPSEELVASEYHKYRQELGFKMDPRLLTFDYDKVLSPIFSKYGFDYISPLDDFRSDKCLDCYYPYDSHMTEVGYRRMAEKVFETIK